jgi:hypothetical protein
MRSEPDENECAKMWKNAVKSRKISENEGKNADHNLSPPNFSHSLIFSDILGFCLWFCLMVKEAWSPFFKINLKQNQKKAKKNA